MTERATYLSDSRFQQEAEPVIVEAAASVTGHGPLPHARVALEGGTYVAVDGVSADRAVFVEAYARQGTLKGAQIKKISQDILKLAMIRRLHPDAQTVIAFASEEAHDSTRGWLRHAAETLGVSLLVVDIPDDLRARIRTAQEGQVMVNLTVGGSPRTSTRSRSASRRRPSARHSARPPGAVVVRAFLRPAGPGTRPRTFRTAVRWRSGERRPRWRGRIDTCPHRSW